MKVSGYESHLKKLDAPFSHTRRASKKGAYKNDDLQTFKEHVTRGASFFSAEGFLAWDLFLPLPNIKTPQYRDVRGVSGRPVIMPRDAILPDSYTIFYRFKKKKVFNDRCRISHLDIPLILDMERECIPLRVAHRECGLSTCRNFIHPS